MTAGDGRFVKDRSGQGAVPRASEGTPLWSPATVVGGRGDTGRRSCTGAHMSGMAQPGLQAEADGAETLGTTLVHLAGQLRAVAEQIPALSPHEAEERLTRTVEALIALTSSLRPGRALTSSRNQPIRFTVEKFIEARLSSPDMSPTTIADGLEIPRSTLYKAFTDRGGVAKYIQDQRLAAARSLLLRSEECRSVRQIAASLGFVNCATFSKAFRKRFGRSPRSMRALGTDHASVLRRSAQPPFSHQDAAT